MNYVFAVLLTETYQIIKNFCSIQALSQPFQTRLNISILFTVFTLPSWAMDLMAMLKVRHLDNIAHLPDSSQLQKYV